MVKTRKSKKKKEFYLSLIIVFLMVSSIFGIMLGGGLGGNNAKYEYNGLKFARTSNNQFYTKINNQDVFFYFFPKELENINLSKEVIDKLRNSYEIDLSSDFDSPAKQTIAQAQFVFERLTQKLTNKYIVTGFLKPTPYGHPVITCLNATTKPVIVYQYSKDESNIEQKGNCIILKASAPEEFIKYTERIIYALVGIMS
jgi:6-pyruvoyl-tetrahydropterin synthase